MKCFAETKGKKKQMLPQSSSICFSATISNKKENEDAHIHFKSNGIIVFAVADGLGTYSAAAEASRQVIEYIKEKEDMITAERTFLTQFFHEINKHLYTIAKNAKYKDYDHEKLLGTTLILGIETEHEVTFAYIGNGAIIHVRGTIGDFDDKVLQWYASNLLNPHSIPLKGSEVLYKLLSNDDEIDVKPTIVRIEKDTKEGDAFIICTDGIASQDHYELFKHVTVGKLYAYNDKLLELFALLKDFQYSDKANASLHLNNKITLFLERNKDKFEDDATLAILVTDNFIKSK